MTSADQENFDPISGASSFEPIRVLQVELSRSLPAVTSFDDETGKFYRRAMALVRLRHQPIGVVQLKLNEEGMTAADFACQIWCDLAPEIADHLRRRNLPQVTEIDPDGLVLPDDHYCGQKPGPSLDDVPRVSIVVATHDRPSSLAVCLRSLLSLNYPRFEIIVVDNAPNSDATANFMEHTYSGTDRMRYIREDQQGLAIAHNRGLQEVANPIVAFTDDDVAVDRQWLLELVRGFGVASDVACVTGMIFPAELETPAQVWIEQHWGLCKGYTQRVFDLREHRLKSPLYPYTAGVFGSGANMAFRTAVLREMGGFDRALGAGTAAYGGDDLSAFFRVIRGGHRLVYEPAAIVHHWHRRDYAGLRRQSYGYGVGLTAYLTKAFLDRPWHLLDFALRTPWCLANSLRPRESGRNEELPFQPERLKTLERLGMLYGPLAYLRSRWKTRNSVPQD